MHGWTPNWPIRGQRVATNRRYSSTAVRFPIETTPKAPWHRHLNHISLTRAPPYARTNTKPLYSWLWFLLQLYMYSLLAKKAKRNAWPFDIWGMLHILVIYNQHDMSQHTTFKVMVLPCWLAQLILWHKMAKSIMCQNGTWLLLILHLLTCARCHQFTW